MTFLCERPPRHLSLKGQRKAYALFFRTKIGHQSLSSFSCSRAKFRPWNLSANISLGPFLSSLAVALKKDLEIVARISPATLSFLLLQSRYAQTLKSWRESLARFSLFFPRSRAKQMHWNRSASVAPKKIKVFCIVLARFCRATKTKNLFLPFVSNVAMDFCSATPEN